MNLPKKLLYSFFVLLFITVTTLFIYLLLSQINFKKPEINFQSSNHEQTQVVNYVIDGDTIKIPTGEKVRYIGINTPETNECYGSQATKQNKKLVGNNKVILVKDTSETDKYNRLLRYVYIENCDQIVDSSFCESNNTLFVNKYLIQMGFATLMQIRPDTKYYNEFKELETKAKESNLGLWKACKK